MADKDMGRSHRDMMALKAQYDAIPVPPEARERILAGIALGREASQKGSASGAAGRGTEGADKKISPGAAGTGSQHNFRNSRNSKKGDTIMKMSKILKNAGIIAAAAVVCVGVLANINVTTANAIAKVPVIGTIAKVVTFRTFEDKSGGFEANIQVPQVESAPAAVNKSIEEYAEGLIAQYENDLKASQGEGNYSLTSSYQVVTDSDRYLCLRIDTTLVMASGTQFTKIFTIDKVTGKTISLTNLFKDKPETLAAVSDNIKEQMRQQMSDDSSKIYFLDSDTPDMDFKGLTGDESFYFDKDGQLVVAFDEYTVAPGYMGAVEFTIPQSVTGKLQ